MQRQWFLSGTELGSLKLLIEPELELLSRWPWHNLFLLERLPVNFQPNHMDVREIVGREMTISPHQGLTP